MSRNTKIVLGIIAGILACCCCSLVVGIVLIPQFIGQFAETAIAEDPELAADIGESLVDYDLPPGYEEALGMDFFGVKMVIIPSADEESLIMMTQFPQALAGNEEQMRQQMETALAQQFGNADYTVEFISDEEITINGEETTLAIFEGETENGVGIRQMLAYFESKEGNPAILMIVGPQNSWDEGGIEDFLQSME